MKKLLTAVALVACLSGAQAQSVLQFTVNLTPGEDGGGARTGSGGGTLSFNPTANTLTFNNIAWSGLSADSTASHIHGPSGPFPSSTGVLYPLNQTYTTTGTGIRSSTFSGTLPLTAGTGGFTIAQQVSQLNGGQWYLNVHSTVFGGGEIRGQITPVPEPSTWALGVLGVALVTVRRFLRR